ncbi:MAG TPA: hypothetical protein VFQ80_01330 [Thermomicrobiales bacterium]|nr:hypothetical protein [Thermomicrobiales bacterium]
MRHRNLQTLYGYPERLFLRHPSGFFHRHAERRFAIVIPSGASPSSCRAFSPTVIPSEVEASRRS